ncbi:MAG: hypothetical protein H8E20_06150 [Verrucomicrobia bacterium]|nr:hypothetical protein [Verrucomicrobiota bacterium]
MMMFQKTAAVAMAALFVLGTGLAKGADEAGQYKTDADIAYRTGPGLTDYMKSRCRLDVYYPTGKKEFATVVWFHGGGLKNGNRSLPAALRGKGIAVVPLIFAGPGVKPGQVCTRPAELLDIYPTLNELLGLPKNKTLEGHSLVPQLRDAEAKREHPAITTHNHGVRSENWRYIQYADGSEELYDLRTGPHEWVNWPSAPSTPK